MLFATFANYAVEDLGHDEGMYLGASYLAMDKNVYSDFSYFQAPYLPLLLSTVFEASGASRLLLTGRRVTFLFHALTVLMIAAITWHFTAHAWATLVFTMLLAVNGFLYGAGYSIDNTTYASACLLLGLWGLLRAHAAGWRSRWLPFASGVLVAIAAGFRLTHLASLGACITAITFDGRKRAMVPFLFGAALGLTPMLVIFFDRAPEFWFDNLAWHSHLRATQLEQYGTFRFAEEFLRDASYYLAAGPWMGVLVVVAAFALLVFFREPGHDWGRFWSFERTLLCLVIAASCAAILTIGTVRHWYLQPLAIAVALLVPSVYSTLGRGPKNAWMTAVILALAYTAALEAPLLANVKKLVQSDSGRPQHYADVGRKLGELARHQGTRRVALVGNPAVVYGVEAKLSLPADAATSAFLCASSTLAAERVSPDRLRSRHVTTQPDLAEAVRRGQIDMLVMSETVLAAPTFCGDEALHRALRESGFRRTALGDGTGAVVVFHR